MAHPIHNGQPQPAGFTLVEVLVVLVIVGTVLAYVSLRLVPDERGALKEEARRLAVLFDHARDEAITTGRSIAWRADGTGYAFWRKDDKQQWTQPAGDEVFRSHVLAPAVTIVSLEIQRAMVPLESGLVFSSSGLNAPFRLELAASERRAAVVGDATGRIRIKEEP